MFSKRSKFASLACLTLLGLIGTSRSQTPTGDGFFCDVDGPHNFTHTLQASITVSSGKNLSAFIIFTEGHRIERIKHGEDLVYTKHGYGSPDNVTLDITFGPNSYSGISSMSTKYIAKDQTMLGTIDGQAIAPYKKDAQSARGPQMADGRAAPTAKLTADLTPEDFTKLNDKIKSIPKDCGQATSFPHPTRDLEARDLIPRDNLDRGYNFGYSPDTTSNAGCVACYLSIEADYAVATAVCIGSSAICAFTFGIPCAVCWAAALSASLVHARICNTGPCCPTACGPQGFLGNSQCCLSGETCLNSDIGLCCKKSETACAGKSCCHGGQFCMTSGPQKGTCCPPQATCNGGLTCCKDGTQCFNGNTCCAPEKQCGGNCCKDGPGGAPFDLGFCANSKTGLCCTGRQVEANGICCLPGEKNVNGFCVDPRGKCHGQVECTDGNSKCPFRQHCDTRFGCCADTIF